MSKFSVERLSFATIHDCPIREKQGLPSLTQTNGL
jgi:hypothetical protein